MLPWRMLAAKDFEPLAAQGNTVAQYHLGAIYSDGQGVVTDYEKAAKWFWLAAGQGHFTKALDRYARNPVMKNGP